MRLAEFLGSIREQRNQDMNNKLKSLQPYLQHEIARREQEVEIGKTRDKAINDAGIMLSNEGYNEQDIKDFSQEVTGIKNPNMISEAVNSFKTKKGIKSALSARGVTIPKGATLTDLQDLYQRENVRYKQVQDMESEIDKMGLGDQWRQLIAHKNMKPEAAWYKVMQNLPDNQADLNAKNSLGSEYMKQYEAAVKSGTPKAQALIDAKYAQDKASYEEKQKTQLEFSPSQNKKGGGSGSGSSGNSSNSGDRNLPDNKEYKDRLKKVGPDIQGGFVFFYGAKGSVLKAKAYVDKDGYLRFEGSGARADVYKLISRSELSNTDKTVAKEYKPQNTANAVNETKAKTAPAKPTKSQAQPQNDAPKNINDIKRLVNKY